MTGGGKEVAMRRVLPRLAGIFVALLAAGPSLAAEQNEVANFYRGRTVTIVVGYSPGGGYDLYARMLSRHMSKYIPGRPTIIVQNMPGAGSLKAANYMYAVAPKDGSFIGAISRANVMAPLFGQAMFDSTKFTWLGNISSDVTTCVTWGASPVKTWNDVVRRDVAMGGSGPDSDPDVFTNLYRNVLGAKMKLITGFPGTRDITYAMERREVDGLCGLSWSTVKSQYADWLRDKKINVLIQAAQTKEPDLPNVPLATELTTDPEKLQILKFIIGGQALARPILAPPGIPTDRKAALRAAFDQTMKDPAFIAETAKVGLDVKPSTGAQVDAQVAAMYRTPKDVVTKASRAIHN
jgi:tripartite-type tricarboxylate transporter receptor subunit TctC